MVIPDLSRCCPTCLQCMNLRARGGTFWCREGVDRDKEWRPASWLVEWLWSKPGRRWARYTGQHCQAWTPEHNELRRRDTRGQHYAVNPVVREPS